MNLFLLGYVLKLTQGIKMLNGPLKKLINEKFLILAQDLIQNPEGLKFKLQKAIEKLEKQNVKEALGEHLENLKVFVRMIKAWGSRRYRKISTQTIVYAVVAVVYFLTPTDLIPDFLLGLGYIDDIGVVTWALSHIKEDLELFKNWEKEKELAAKTAVNTNTISEENNHTPLEDEEKNEN